MVKPEDVVIRMSTRNDGMMGPNAKREAEVQLNQIRFLGTALRRRLVMPGVEFGTGIAVVHSISEVPENHVVPDVDAVIVKRHSNPLLTPVPGVRTQDCPPMIVTSPEFYSAVHLGWPCVVSDLPTLVVEKMMKLGVRTEDLRIRLLHGVHSCCFTVRDDDRGVKNYLPRWERHVTPKGRGQWSADLYGIIRDQLAQAGLGRAQISDKALCTACPRNRCLLFSWRRDGIAGANMLTIAYPRER